MKKLQIKRTLLCWLFGLGISLSVYSQTYPDNKISINPGFTYDQWTVEEGLPVNSVNDILQSQDGYMWIGTNDGLVRFDGIRFKVYKSSEYEGLPNNRISEIIEAFYGSIWLKTDRQELVQLKNGIFKQITEKVGLNGNNVHFFSNDSDSNLWIGSNSGVSIYKNGILTPYFPDVITEQVSQIYVDDQNVLWYKDNENLHLYRFDGNTKTYLATTSETTDPTPFLTLKNGHTIFATQGHLYRYGNGTIEEPIGDLPKDFQITDFFQDSLEVVIIASLERGVYKLDEEKLILVNSEYKGRKRGAFLYEDKHLWIVGNDKILFDNDFVFSFQNQITHYIYDREGSFWFGTPSTGLFRLKPNLFKIFSENEGVPNRNIYPVYETDDGSIWFGTHGNGPVRLKNNILSYSYTFQPKPENQYVRSIIQRHNGDLLVSLLGDGIYKYNKENSVFEKWKSPPQGTYLGRVLTVGSLFEDRKRRLWAGSNYGLFVMTDTLWQRILDKDLNPDHSVRYITEAPDNSLWMATNGGGILHYKSGNFTTYSVENGLSSNLIRSLFVDTTSSSSEYDLWIGSEDKGLNKVTIHNFLPDFSKILSINEKEGLYDNAVHKIMVDNSDRFWMSGNKGIFWVHHSQLDQFETGQISEVHSTAYTEQDGLRNREANGGIQSSGTKSKDGKLWFPTQDGLVMINPDNISQNEKPPPIVIEEIKSGETRISKKENQFLLTPKQRNFEVAYTGLSFLVPEKVRFRYRLKNFIDDWTEAGTRRVAFFTNVPAGTYEFEVLATNNEGIWTQSPTTEIVTIQPFFYEQSLFYVFSSVFFAIIFILTIRFRTKSQLKREKELERSVSIRTEELQSEKKKTELQAQELLKLDKAKSQFFTNITHEFRTPLTLIIGPLLRLLKSDRDITDEEARFEIERVLRSSHRLQRLIDQILDVSKLEAGELKLNVQSTDLVHFVNSLLTLFQPLAEEQEQSLELNTELTESLVYLDSDALEKILANLISNAIKFTPRKGRIIIELDETETECIIKILDSGIGIQPEKVAHVFDRFYQADESSTRVAEGSGIGLALVKNLIELHKGSIEVISEVGKGSIFTIFFKKGKKHFSNQTVLSDHRKLHSPQINPQKYSGFVPDPEQLTAHDDLDTPTILVVEDNADMRDFISSALCKSFSVIQAADGVIALDLIKQNLPDLIIADIMMPNMDGMELNKVLKKDPMLESIPLIFLTAKTTTDDKVKGFENGADDYLTKPFDADLLVARVENIIQKRKKLRAYFLEKKSIEANEEINDPFLQEVLEILEQHFANPDFGVLELSELLHLDRTRLYRKIKERTNIPPQLFLSYFRLKKAGQMIEKKQGNFSEIAYASGFNSLAYFSKAFKKYYKVSPSEYTADNFET